jgi:hypothetical protein
VELAWTAAFRRLGFVEGIAGTTTQQPPKRGRTKNGLRSRSDIRGTEHVCIARNTGLSAGGLAKIDKAKNVIPDDAPRLILATGSYIGTGFDDARLDTLFLARPNSWKGTLQQCVGRLHRHWV